jgi:hypothetical protein
MSQQQDTRRHPPAPTPAETRPAGHPTAAQAADVHRGSPRRSRARAASVAAPGSSRTSPHALRSGQVLNGRVHAAIQHLPPPERPRQSLDHRVVDSRPRRPRRAVRRHHQLPSAAPPDVIGMWTLIVSPSAEIVARFTPPPSCCPQPRASARRARSAAAGGPAVGTLSAGECGNAGHSTHVTSQSRVFRRQP